MSGIETSDGFIAVGRIDDSREGKLRSVKVAGEDVVLARVGGSMYVISSCCTHRGAPFADGELEGIVVVYSLQGGQFDTTAGRVVSLAPNERRGCVRGTNSRLECFA